MIYFRKEEVNLSKNHTIRTSYWYLESGTFSKAQWLLIPSCLAGFRSQDITRLFNVPRITNFFIELKGNLCDVSSLETPTYKKALWVFLGWETHGFWFLNTFLQSTQVPETTVCAWMCSQGASPESLSAPRHRTHWVTDSQWIRAERVLVTQFPRAEVLQSQRAGEWLAGLWSRLLGLALDFPSPQDLGGSEILLLEQVPRCCCSAAWGPHLVPSNKEPGKGAGLMPPKDLPPKVTPESPSPL